MEAAYVFCGSLYNARDEIIEEPSILLDPKMDVFLGWGESAAIQAKQVRCNQAGLNLTAVELSAIPKEAACYIIRRMAEYTASGFVQQFCEHQGGPDALDWLASEMQRVPISTERIWESS